MRIERLTEHLGGVARTAQLYANGFTQSHVRAAVRSGVLHRVRFGVYAVEPRSDAAIAAAHGGSVTCLSALRALGIFVLSDDANLHVRLGSGDRARDHDGCSCVVHYDRGGPRVAVMRVSDALIAAARCLTSEAFFAAFESAWRLGLLSPAARTYVRTRVPARLKRLIDIARPNSDSGLESILWLRFRALGLTLRCQVHIPGVGRVDFVVGRIVIEVDGRLGHADPASRHKDLRRDAIARAQGYETLRFDYALVIYEWHVVQAAVLNAVG